MSIIKTKNQRFTTKNYYYEDHHTLYLAIKFNPDFIQPTIEDPNAARFEVVQVGIDYDYINSTVGQDRNTFILSIPGPEKCYSFSGVEKQYDWNDLDVYVGINQINGSITIHWDIDLFEEETKRSKTLDELNISLYKIRVNTNRITPLAVEGE